MIIGRTVLTSLGKHLIDMRVISALIAASYVIVYFYIPATPGNHPNEHPLGWWGWFDQGKYLLSANALAQFDFSPDKHFYPPLYPAIGAFFIKWSSGHFYFALNLAALLWFSYAFVRFSDRYIPRWGSILLLFGTTIFNYTLFENYVIPWTSTLSVALLSTGILGLVWLHEVRDGIRTRLSKLQAFFVATCLGLLVPTRPVDAVVGGVIGLGLLISYWQTRRKFIQGVPPITHFLILTIVGSVIGPLLFLGFNMAVYSTPLGDYMVTAGANGYFPSDLAEKFVSLWLDGFTLYGEPDAGLTERYPWLFLSLAGLMWALVLGDAPLRSIAFAIVFLFVLYLPYGDLLPNGLWRYLNIHYFKWTFPFLALFAVLLVRQTMVSWHRREEWVIPSSFLFGIPFLLLSLHLAVDVTPISTRTTNNLGAISFELNGNEIDFVDFKGLSGGFTDVYFGKHRLLLDGRELKQVRDYRLLPMAWGTRLLFIRPVVGRSLEFLPDHRLALTLPIGAQLGIYRFAFGVLKPFRRFAQPEIVTDYHLGDIIDFSQHGMGSLYTFQGWSEPEVWGRWSVNGEAAIQMRLADSSSKALELELVMGAFVTESHPCQEVGILVNEKEIARQPLCLGKGGEQPSSYKFVLPRELLRSDGKIDIRLDTPHSISPKTLGISSDGRVLGAGVRSLLLTASQN
jgi:hypothetical protein